MLVWPSIIILLAGLFNTSSIKIPSYIRVCKRNEPKINECILNSINGLRPNLIKGIPEFNIPSIEPLRFKKVDFSRGPNMKAIGTDIVVTGASGFQIESLKADIHNIVYEFKVKIPHLNILSKYEAKMKILTLQIKGNGPLKANLTDINFTAILKGHKFQNGNQTKVKFDSLNLNINWEDYYVRLDNMFKENKAMNDAVNIVLNDNKKEVIQLVRPILEKSLSEVFLDNANKITEKFLYEELFPLD